MRHPELAAAKANRDFVLRAVCSAVDTISAVAQGRPLPPASGTIGKLLVKASRGAGASSVTGNAIGCAFDPHLRK